MNDEEVINYYKEDINSLSGKNITVWFSCGAASALAAKLTIMKYGNDNNVRIVNNPIKEEHSDNTRFLKDVEKWLGQEIEFAINSKYPDFSCKDVWEDNKFMSGPLGAPCTRSLKKHARQQWEVLNPTDYTVLGFTAEEQKRAARFKVTERSNLLPILIHENKTKQDCFDILAANKIDIPEIYKLGFPNANCIGCVKATSPTYWNLVRSTFPEIYQDRADQSRRIGARLVRHKGERIFLDELPKDAKGRPLKNYDIECGIFCDEWARVDNEDNV